MSEAKKKKRTEAWFTVVAVAVGLPAAALVTFLAYVFSIPPIHANPESVRSAMHSPPLPKWTGAVEQGQEIARTRIVEQNVPGLSVAVGVAGEIVWAEGFGWANLESKAPVTPGMRFRIGHVSKALTAAGVGVLREQGRLHLDEEIQTYVPAYPQKQWPVTLRQLMAHVGGVHHYRDTEWLEAGTQESMERVNRPDCSLEMILANILLVARERPVIIQSLFPCVNGEAPPQSEIEAYVQRLLDLKKSRAQISLVQIYSATRPTPHSECGHLPLPILSAIARRVRVVTGLKAEVF
jgi:hypothetical protein